MKHLKIFILCQLSALLLLASCSDKGIQVGDGLAKREFRGAWIQAVNGQFQGLSTAEMQRTLTYQLDELQKDGVNAIIFQVRPECDALYNSPYEPWSRFLTGVQGQAPSPYWDPLEWMVKECHRRGMELHAWINPFRAKTKFTTVLASTHIASTHPERIFEYDGLYILNPAYSENRDYICKVVQDIVRRYDVDGLHIDDYFYPYPVAGLSIPDDREYNAHQTAGGKKLTRGDWRRENVNVFIKQLSDAIKQVKPWVKFGVSPFGIYRNQKNDPQKGSNTAGLQNYDDLYADVLLWVNKGWIDYCVPQIYWQIGHKTADYQTLIEWWNKYASNRPLFIGEDVERTVKYADLNNPNSNQMPAKFLLHKQMRNVNGTVLWYAKAVTDDVGKYGTALRTHYWKTPALQPLMPFIDNKAPKHPKKLKPVLTKDGYVLFWQQPKGSSWNDQVQKYVVYRFSAAEKINLDDASKIVAITTNTMYKLPTSDQGREVVYIVTALDRMGNESKGTQKAFKLKRIK